MEGHQGYLSSRPFLNERAPQHIQNLVIRDYCQRNQLKYLLSATEYAMSNCYLTLEQLLKKLELGELDGIVFYSLCQLPERIVDRQTIFDRVLSSGKDLHFATEMIVVRDYETRERVNDILSVATTLLRSPCPVLLLREMTADNSK